MCTMYNLSVENLSYKWQALSYSNTNTLAIFTLQSVPDLKARLQQELGRLNASKQEPSRSAARVLGRGRGRTAKAPATSRLNEGLKIGPLRSAAVKSEFSGPGRVTFQGPRSDGQSRKSRACKRSSTPPRASPNDIAPPDRYMYEKVTERSEGGQIFFQLSQVD